MIEKSAASDTVDGMIGTAERGYRPGLDGIRALAVGAVLAFHLGRLPGGNLGVDAFFVVSGWLITWKLLSDIERDGRVDIRKFWASRLRRLLPASMAVLVALAVVWPLAGIDVASLRRDIAWAAVGLSNWGTISGGGDYWARFGEPSPVTHFWSLAIEQQFYLVWPIVLLVVVALTVRVRLAIEVVSVAGAVASVVLMNALFDPGDPTAVYMNTFARAHTLLIGAAAGALTIVLPDGRLRFGTPARRFAPIAAGLAVTIILASSERSTWLFSWGFPLFALAIVVVVVATADGFAEPVMASAPMRWVGDRSYGLYLWHWPVFLLLSPDRVGIDESWAPMLALDAVRVALAVALADVSYRYLETPIRRRQRLPRWHATVAAGLSLALLAVLLVTVVPRPASTSAESVITLPPANTTASSEPMVEQRERTETSSNGSATATAPSAVPSGPLRVLVTGDSLAVHLSEALLAHAASRPDDIVAGSAAFGGCGLSAASDGRLHEFTNLSGERELLDISGCVGQWASVPQRVRDEAIDVVLVDIGPWDALDMHLADGQVVSVADEVGRDLLAAAYVEFVALVTSAGATIVWVMPADSHLGWGKFDDPVNDPGRWDAIRAIIDGLGVVRIDLPGWLSASGLEGPDGRPDGVHLGPGLNERFVVEQVAPALDDLRLSRPEG